MTDDLTSAFSLLLSRNTSVCRLSHDRSASEKLAERQCHLAAFVISIRARVLFDCRIHILWTSRHEIDLCENMEIIISFTALFLIVRGLKFAWLTDVIPKVVSKRSSKLNFECAFHCFYSKIIYNYTSIWICFVLYVYMIWYGYRVIILIYLICF